MAKRGWFSRPVGWIVFIIGLILLAWGLGQIFMSDVGFWAIATVIVGGGLLWVGRQTRPRAAT